MCFLCLKDNPLEAADEFARVWGPKTVGEVRAKAVFIKSAIKAIEDSKDKLCHVGDGALKQLREEQYRLAQQL